MCKTCGCGIENPLRLTEKQFISRCKSTLSAMGARLDGLYNSSINYHECYIKGQLDMVRQILGWFNER